MVRLNRKTIVNGEPCAPRGARTVREGVSTSGLPHNLDTEVAKLKLLKAAHQSQQYKLEDRLLKIFPEQIESERQHIAGFEADIQTAKDNEAPHGEFAGMTVLGRDFSEKEAAGTAILNACKMVKDLQGVELGNYRGFHMSLALSTFSNEYMLMLRGQMAHAIALGTDPRGNILRIDNALSTIPERLEKAQTELDNLQKQQEATKQEAGKPFAQEAELKEKSARLAELDAALNMEANGKQQANREDERDSVQEPHWEDEQERDNDSSPDREQGVDEHSSAKSFRQMTEER